MMQKLKSRNKVGYLIIALLIGCNLGLILIPYLFGFSYFGDTRVHLPAIERIINGQASLFSSYYLSWYAFSVLLVKYLSIHLNWLMLVYPVLTYAVFIFGFCLLSRTMALGNWVVFLPAAAFLFGLGNIGIMPYFFGASLLPALLALQFMIASNHRSNLIGLSLLLFAVIVFSHPFNFAFCSVFLAVFWILKRGSGKAYLSGLIIIFLAAGAYYGVNRDIWAYFEGVKAITLSNISPNAAEITPPSPMPLFDKSPFIFLQYIAQGSLLLVGLIASFYFGRKKQYTEIIALFIVELAIGFWSISGVFLLRSFTRMFAYALLASLILEGLLLNELLLKKDTAAGYLLLHIVIFYFFNTLGVVMRYPEIYLEVCGR